MSLSFNPDTLPLPIGHFIGGELIEVPGEIDMKRPSDGKPYAGCPIAGPEMVDRAVESAKAALKASNWRGLRQSERVRVMYA